EMRELSVLKKPYGLYGLISKWKTLDSGAREAALQKMVLKSILGVPCYEAPSKVDRVYSRSITWSSLFLGGRLTQDQAKAMGKYSRGFIDSAMQAATIDDLRIACSVFINGVLRIDG